MKLYRYMCDNTFNKYLPSILKGEVHLSQWREFNDPMEGYFQYLLHSDPQHVVNAIVSEKTEYRVCCFSKKYTKYLLWSYYANKHKGVCLEYEVSRKQLPQDVILQPIDYSNTLPQLDASIQPDEQARKFLLKKTMPWQHELEVRLLCRNAKNTEIPFGELTGIILGVRRSEGVIQNETLQQVYEAQNMSKKLRVYEAILNSDSITLGRKMRLEGV
jgi:hypothetical protein